MPEPTISSDFTNSQDVPKSVLTVPKGCPRKSRQAAEKYSSLGFDADSLLAELRSDLDLKRLEEARIQKEIDDVTGSFNAGQADASRTFSMAVSRLNNALLLIDTDVKQLANSLKVSSRLADNISSKVSALDVAKTRVVECLQLAADMRDLGVCSDGVDAAITAEDYETAAQHIHRFLTLDSAVFQIKDAESRETGQSVKHSYDILTDATVRLKEILRRRLTEAINANDAESIKRFVRLFPLIKEHAIGLELFSNYVAAQISKSGDDNIKIMLAGGTDDNRRSVLFADSLFLFFEAVAGVIETHQSLVENSYGPEHYLDFIQTLQKEVDQTVKKILAEFTNSRQWDRATKSVEKYLRDRQKALEKPDALALDAVIAEVSQMIARAEMYTRFLKRRVNIEKTARQDDDDDELDPEAKTRREAERKQRREEREKKLDTLLNRSALGTSMQEIMGRYIQFEYFYMIESLEKAVSMDQREDGQLTSSLVDDALFICRKCIQRSLSTSSVDAACATINNVCTLLETNFCSILADVLKVGYPTGYVSDALQTAQTAYNVLQHGKASSETGPEAQREQFIVSLNNARSAAETVADLKKSLAADTAKIQRSPNDSAKLEHSLSQLDEVSSKLRGLAEQAVSTLSVAVFRPKFKTSCEAYLDISHTLSEEQLQSYEAADPFVEALLATIDKVIAPFQISLLEANYSALLLCMSSEVCKQWERVIFKCNFNRLGGLQLDKEFRQLTNYLSTVAGWSARERCVRLSQVVALLNVDSVEEAGDMWRLSPSAHLGDRELRAVLSLRVDLPTTLIQQLTL